MNQPENLNNEQMKASRRGFLKKATVSSALIATVSSRPVWATNCTVSAMPSANLSHHVHETVCHTYSAPSSHGWANKYGYAKKWWRYIPIRKKDKVNRIFTAGGWPSSNVIDVLKHGGEYHKQMMTALLNACAMDEGIWDIHSSFPFSISDIIDANQQLTSTQQHKVGDFIAMLSAGQHMN